MAKNITRASVAVVGIGNWGKNIVRVCRDLGVLGAICDQDDKKTNLFSYEYEVAAKTWEEVLLDPGITAVVITLPANLHEKYAEEAFVANKHVFVEKPMAMSQHAAKKLYDMANRYKKILMVGHILQYHNAYIKLKELVLAGAIGDIKYIESTRMHLGPVRKEIGILWELLPHDISILLGLVSSPLNNIKLSNKNFLNNYTSLNFADVIDVQLEFANGVHARVTSSWLHPIKEQKFWVVGTKGMLVFNNTVDWGSKLQLFLFNGVNAEKQVIAVTEVEPLKAEIEEFIYCIANNTIPKTDGKEGYEVVKLLEQIAIKASRELEQLAERVPITALP